MTHAANRVPPHLRGYVVEQDYSQYTGVDQAVWRFVLLQMYDKLQVTAHAAYRKGLGDTGISVERIPSLAEMDACLSRFGWGAVAVNGFIPPRAFTEFQALGLLPICAEIRTADHLVYTPAPDIIHEAAGHAPLIVDPHFARYLRRIGEVGARAFRSPEDDVVYDAIFQLSEIKERPGAAPDEIARAEQRFEHAKQRIRRVSEATRVSRLYWWTAEYGLVGTVEDYKLYGAGLLSSLGESNSCHHPSVKKLPLTVACADVDYDITHAQPQLFVAADFDQLHDVLEELAGTLAFRTGGARALDEAVQSDELCTLSLDTGLELIGRVSLGAAIDGTTLLVARLGGRVALAREGRLLPALPGGDVEDCWVLLGQRADGSSLAMLNEWHPDGAPFEWALGDGVILSGRRARRHDAELQPVFEAEELRLRTREQVVHAPRASFVFGGALLGARAGASDPNYYESTEPSADRVPLPRTYPPAEARMIELYTRALAAHRSPSPSAMLESFGEIHAVLRQQYPRDWLLRWNLLESLVKRDLRGELADALRLELNALEREFRGEQPIASGLRYLAME
ncbi:MAG TPA: aromatic amino acid hydroxylase [Polyangiaceae bacterium]|nr:aromatic amino acid hydroxylase [Polyangiaceae bacterium]